MALQLRSELIEQVIKTLFPPLLFFTFICYGTQDLYKIRDPDGVVAVFGTLSHAFRDDAVYPPVTNDIANTVETLSALCLVGLSLNTAFEPSRRTLQTHVFLLAAFYLAQILMLFQSTKATHYNTMHSNGSGALLLSGVFSFVYPLSFVYGRLIKHHQKYQ